MELNKHQREALLEKLNRTKTDLDNATSCMQQAGKSTLVHWHEMDVFVLEQQIKLITKALIDNEIEF